MHNHDDKYPARPGFERSTPRLQAPVDTNEQSGPATGWRVTLGDWLRVRVESSRYPLPTNVFILFYFI